MFADRAGATVVVEHSELEEGVRHEEDYYVARGHATFEVDGERIDAPEGTFVHVPDPASKRAAAAEAAGTVIVAVGGEPGVAFAPSAWEDAWAGA
jgi:quercetin dioxygenase-like cupin family protein